VKLYFHSSKKCCLKSCKYVCKYVHTYSEIKKKSDRQYHFMSFNFMPKCDIGDHFFFNLTVHNGCFFGAEKSIGNAPSYYSSDQLFNSNSNMYFYVFFCQMVISHSLGVHRECSMSRICLFSNIF
jgi:hypothetical protein